MERVPLRHLAEGLRCMVCGTENAHSLGVRFDLVGDHVEARWVPPPSVEGWPGLAHGAVFGALHDEAAAWAMIALAGRTGFTTHMEQRFLKPLRLGAPLLVRGRPEQVGDRSGTFATEILLGDGSLASTARTTYAFLDEASIARLLDGPVSPRLAAWMRASPDERRAMVAALGRGEADPYAV
jgi:acyl-CoA thioesterase FadM